MKNYIKEIIILILQLCMFYILPLFAGPTDMMGMVLLIILATLILSILIGSISKSKIKFLYPIIVSLMFIPSIYIYYNETALIHSVWHLIVSVVGLLVGTIIYELTHKVNLAKKVLLVILIVIGIILLDSILALIFDNSPILKIREYYDGGKLHYKDKGLLVDTYCGTNGIKDTTIKGFSYSLSYDPNITIIDKTKEIEGLTFDTAEELFYEDENYGYFFGCIKSEYIVVKYSDGTEETVKEALKNNRIEIGYLDKFNIHYIKKEKLHMYE